MVFQQRTARYGWAVAAGVLLAVAHPTAAGDARSERAQLVTVLERTLDQERGWPRIRAAEALIDHGYTGRAFDALAGDADTAPSPERIGVWRVLARSAPAPEGLQFIERIRRAAVDPNGPDRVHAVETLAKLNAYEESDRAVIEAIAGPADPATAAFARWYLALSGRPDDEARLVELLVSPDAVARQRSAYALARLKSPSPAARAAIVAQTERESPGSPVRTTFAAAAYLTSDDAGRGRWRTPLIEALTTGSDADRTEVAAALGRLGTPADLGWLTPLTESPDGSVRAAAASALLHILRREPQRLGAWDWVAIGAYLVGMLGVGVYYARGNDTREEYLLGGRAMKPWAVGLSFFATIFSTITYLSWPGEVIKHGPMMLCQLIGFPVAFALVGWFIIPFVMRLRVTSAYEILEYRFGLATRLLGSTLFLAMRLFWMAVIVYTTSTEILIPVAGLSPGFAPILSLAIGVLTVVYTSMGGFKAVVVTDVAQTCILFGGAVLTVLVITVYFGGFGWFPTRWNPDWQAPSLGYDPSARVTLLNAVMSLVVWHVCTAGSDQMAVQRHLSTRDAAAARRMYGTALAANAVVYVVLAVLGLALFAYFRDRPDMLAAGQSISGNADQLFSQYVVFGLPEGLSGLVIAGLLAAAMSSLSSGVNSSSAVLAVDFIERASGGGAASARSARLVSWVVGAVVVGLSTLIGAVEGNLLERTYKVVNLLTAPLFGLFFMAMFVRWATVFGTWVGAAVGVGAAVVINYWASLFGSNPPVAFMWAMPVALACQIVAGCLASLIPVGIPRPMIARAEPTRTAPPEPATAGV